MNKLNEVLWEFTNKCNKNCEYCGSKDLMNNGAQELTIEQKLDVCKQIVSMGINELTFTGGEPSVKSNDLYKVVQYFRDNAPGIKLKILTNGNLFKGHDLYRHGVIIDNMTSIGLSLNTLDDILELRKYRDTIPYEKTAAVINFGKHNIGDFVELIKAGLNFCAIQVQLTMGNDLQLDLPQIRTLLEDIKKVNESGLGKIYIGDNLSYHTSCVAGKSACSITFDGKVVACLSHRCFTKIKYHGNLLTDKFSDIWSLCFSEYRNRDAEPLSCKDCTRICKLKQSTDTVPDTTTTITWVQEELKTDWTKGAMPTLITYGVGDFHDQHVYVYGVINPNTTGYYAGKLDMTSHNNTNNLK